MNKNKTILYILYAVVIVLLVYVAYVTRGFGIWKEKDTEGFSTGSYQAVFLSNGQVYFGKLTDTNSKYAKLTDIYYLQVQKIQPADTSTTDTQNKLTLIKLGNELHAPVDEMKINTDQVLFIEDLKEEGKVMQAMKRYSEQGPDKASDTSTDVQTTE